MTLGNQIASPILQWILKDPASFYTSGCIRIYTDLVWDHSQFRLHYGRRLWICWGELRIRTDVLVAIRGSACKVREGCPRNSTAFFFFFKSFFVGHIHMISILGPLVPLFWISWEINVILLGFTWAQDALGSDTWKCCLANPAEANVMYISWLSTHSGAYTYALTSWRTAFPGHRPGSYLWPKDIGLCGSSESRTRDTDRSLLVPRAQPFKVREGCPGRIPQP